MRKISLGGGQNIKFIHFTGYDLEDVEEFICLSMCNHRIFSASSSFSDLADRINASPNKRVICQGDLDKSLYELVFRSIKKRWKSIKWMILTACFDDYKEQKERLERDRLIKHYTYLDEHKIRYYSKRYKKVYNHTDNISVTLETCVNENNAADILSNIRTYETDHYPISEDKEIRLWYSKFCAYYVLKDYERAIGQADAIWGRYIKDCLFKTRYADALKTLGHIEEGKLIDNECDTGKVGFVLFPSVPSVYSSTLYGMGELAVGLAKMGYNVAIVQNPADETEKIYITNHRYMTNRHEVNLGCRQYISGIVDDISIVKEYAENNPDIERVIVITRTPTVMGRRFNGVESVFFDFCDEHDPERHCITMISDEDYKRLVEESDYILTCNGSVYGKLDRSRVIEYSCEMEEYPTWSTDRRWQQSDCHRLSMRTIRICESIREWLKT